jgi:hypothetical protein
MKGSSRSVMLERCVNLKTFCISSSDLAEHFLVLHLLDLDNLKVGAGLRVLDSSLDPVLESVAINRHDHVDLLKVLSARLKSLLVSVNVTVARAGRSSIDIKVDYIATSEEMFAKKSRDSAYSLWCSGQWLGPAR